MARRKTLAEKHALRVARRDYKLSKSTDGHETGRQSLIKALSESLGSCNFGGLRIKVGNTLVFNSNKRLTS